jgi:hypothetical protein
MYYVLLTASMYQRLTSLLRLSNHGHMPHALFPHYSPFQPFKKTLQTLLINQEGHLDPARCMVLLLQSRRIRFRALERDASWLHRFLPSKAEVRASSPAHPLPPKARMALLVVPVLDAQVNNILINPLLIFPVLDAQVNNLLTPIIQLYVKTPLNNPLRPLTHLRHTPLNTHLFYIPKHPIYIIRTRRQGRDSGAVTASRSTPGGI